jgi:hypothetical protein
MRSDIKPIMAPVICRPFSIPNPADAGCNSDLAQYSNTPTLHHSITPSLRAAGFEDEDDDEDENEAPCNAFGIEPTPDAAFAH